MVVVVGGKEENGREKDEQKGPHCLRISLCNAPVIGQPHKTTIVTKKMTEKLVLTIILCNCYRYQSAIYLRTHSLNSTTSKHTKCLQTRSNKNISSIYKTRIIIIIIILQPVTTKDKKKSEIKSIKNTIFLRDLTI